jgi:hypothetical protein
LLLLVVAQGSAGGEEYYRSDRQYGRQCVHDKETG